MTEKPPNANVLVIPRCREVMLRFQYNQDHVLMYLYMQNSEKTSESFGVMDTPLDHTFGVTEAIFEFRPLS